MSVKENWYQNMPIRIWSLFDNHWRNSQSLENSSNYHQNLLNNSSYSTDKLLNQYPFADSLDRFKENKMIFNKMNNAIDKEVNAITISQLLRQRDNEK